MDWSVGMSPLWFICIKFIHPINHTPYKIANNKNNKQSTITLKPQNIHFLTCLKLIFLVDTLLRVNDLGLGDGYSFLLLSEKVRYGTFPVLHILMNDFISLHPRVKGSLRITLKYFSRVERRSSIILGFLLVFFQRWVLGNSGNSI